MAVESRDEWLIGLGTYQQRDVNIDILGFKTYSTYLRSPLWQIVRKEVLRRDKYKCQAKGCKRKAQEVHHLSYSIATLVGRNAGMMVSLCRDCHEECEFDSKGNKLTAVESRIKIFSMVTGIERKKGVSDIRIGAWYQCRWEEEGSVAARERIRLALLKWPVYAIIMKLHWREPPKKHKWRQRRT